MKNLLEYIVNHLVLHPEDVRIEESEQDGMTLFTIHVHADDVGRVIGRKGNVINSIRQIATVRAMLDKVRVRVTVADGKPVDGPANDTAEDVTQTEQIAAQDESSPSTELN